MTINLKVNSKIIVSNNIILNVVKSLVFTRKEKKHVILCYFGNVLKSHPILTSSKKIVNVTKKTQCN